MNLDKGRFWQIPLDNGMPKIKNRKRGPKGTWNKRRQQASNYITVNRHKIAKNKKEKNAVEKVLSVKRGRNKTVSTCHYVDITGPCRLVYQPKNPLNCGATVWIEADPKVKLITKVFAAIENTEELVFGAVRAAA